MVIDNFDFIGIPFFPFETYSPLVIDADTVLSLAVTLQSLQAVAGGNSQVLQAACAMQIKELAARLPLAFKPDYLQRLNLVTI